MALPAMFDPIVNAPRPQKIIFGVFGLVIIGAAAWFLGMRTALIRKHDVVKVGGRNWRPRHEVEENEEE